MMKYDLIYIPYEPILGQCSHFIPPENTRKTKGFLVFSADIKWELWPEMG